MSVRVRVDSKGRITIPKSIRENVGIKEGDEVILHVEKGMLIIKKSYDPFKRLEELIGDLTFDRSLRLVAEREALKDVKGTR